MDRHDEFVELSEAGLTYAEIGRRQMPPISKQRVEQIVKGNPKSSRRNLDSKVMLTGSDVAYWLGIHVNTVRRWSQKGLLRAYRIGSRGDRRFKREDIDRFLQESQIGG